MSLRDKIKTYEDVCNHLGIDINDDIPYLNPKTSKQISQNAYSRLDNIVRCLNGDWRPNWLDSRECKYYPYFRNSSKGASHGSGRATMQTESSSGFAFDFTHYVTTATVVGSRLCFKTREDADYCGKTFLFIYKDFMMYNERIDHINEILK